MTGDEGDNAAPFSDAENDNEFKARHPCGYIHVHVPNLGCYSRVLCLCVLALHAQLFGGMMCENRFIIQLSDRRKTLMTRMTPARARTQQSATLQP